MEIGKSKYEVIYWKSTADIDEELCSLVEQQANMVLADTLEDVISKMSSQTAIIFVDLRDEIRDGEGKLSSMREVEKLEKFPVLAVCGHNELQQFTVAINYEVEVVDLPVNKEALMRRGKRVFAGIKNQII